MTIFWILYVLAGLAVTIIFTDYLIPWTTNQVGDAAEKSSLELIFSDPFYKTLFMGVIFVVWPLLFGYVLLTGLWALALIAYDEVKWQFGNLVVHLIGMKYRRRLWKMDKKKLLLVFPSADVKEIKKAAYKKYNDDFQAAYDELREANKVSEG